MLEICFVGIKKDWNDLLRRDYIEDFVRFHLELPYYYSRKANVHLVSDIDYDIDDRLKLVKEPNDRYDVLIHWRKWFEEYSDIKANHVINCQDHSFSYWWKQKVCNAFRTGELYGILCFEGWHERNLKSELLSHDDDVNFNLVTGLTLGVDTDIYYPDTKREKSLLWASDPGRGIYGAIELTKELWSVDKDYILDVCWPDYVNGARWSWVKNLPFVRFHGNINNSKDLWNLFNTAQFLPYSSVFKEPSSRSHRQAQSSGCIVFYPPNMGTPSELIKNGSNGFVIPLKYWRDTILELSDEEIFNISENARLLAVSENWNVQTNRFVEFFNNVTGY